MDRQLSIDAGRAALRAGVVGNILAVASAAMIFREPVGSAIRPMDVPVFLLLIAVGTATPALHGAILAIRRDRQILVGLIGILLGLSPLPLGLLALMMFVHCFGYTLKS